MRSTRRRLAASLTVLGAVAAVAAPAAQADEYWDNGLNQATGYGFVMQVHGPDQPTTIMWYDANGNWGYGWPPVM